VNDQKYSRNPCSCPDRFGQKQNSEYTAPDAPLIIIETGDDVCSVGSGSGSIVGDGDGSDGPEKRADRKAMCPIPAWRYSIGTSLVGTLGPVETRGLLWATGE
jgi:hypothetical protein